MKKRKLVNCHRCKMMLESKNRKNSKKMFAREIGKGKTTCLNMLEYLKIKERNVRLKKD